MRIAIASDHAAVVLKRSLAAGLREAGHQVLDLGARLMGEDMARASAEASLAAEFEGGRHQHRVDKLCHPLQQAAITAVGEFA